MHNRFYISYEAARLLKEKGYKEDVSRYYDEDGFLHFLEFDENYNYFQMSNNDLDLDHYAAPTKSEAIDWLDSKGKIIEVLQDYRGRWFYVIKEVCVGEDDSYFTTRLEAEDAAIIKALELL